MGKIPKQNCYLGLFSSNVTFTKVIVFFALLAPFFNFPTVHCENISGINSWSALESQLPSFLPSSSWLSLSHVAAAARGLSAQEPTTRVGGRLKETNPPTLNPNSWIETQIMQHWHRDSRLDICRFNFQYFGSSLFCVKIKYECHEMVFFQNSFTLLFAGAVSYC